MLITYQEWIDKFHNGLSPFDDDGRVYLEFFDPKLGSNYDNSLIVLGWKHDYSKTRLYKCKSPLIIINHKIIMQNILTIMYTREMYEV